MKLRYHSIPRELFDALAAGGGGPAAIDALAAAEQSKHALLLRGVSAAAQAADATQAWFARTGWEVLTTVERHDRDVAAQVTRYPAVGAWAIDTLRALRTDAGSRWTGSGFSGRAGNSWRRCTPPWPPRSPPLSRSSFR
jgi:HEXXH motif-containing protein